MSRAPRQPRPNRQEHPMSHSRVLNSYFTLGRTRLRLSRPALGTMTFGTEWGWRTDKETARALVNTYVDAGGNLLDHDDPYTHRTSQTWVGGLLAHRAVPHAVRHATTLRPHAPAAELTRGRNEPNKS